VKKKLRPRNGDYVKIKGSLAYNGFTEVKWGRMITPIRDGLCGVEGAFGILKIHRSQIKSIDRRRYIKPKRFRLVVEYWVGEKE